jgi:hypothetical protein
MSSENPFLHFPLILPGTTFPARTGRSTQVLDLSNHLLEHLLRPWRPHSVNHTSR